MHGVWRRRTSPLGAGRLRHAATARSAPGVAVWLLAAGLAGAQASDPLSFSRDVVPILETKCLQCHGELQQQSGLDLRTPQTILKGGQRGPVIVPGKARESRLYQRVAGIEAPVMPMGGEIDEEQILVLRDWIDQGAHFDGKETAAEESGSGGASLPKTAPSEGQSAEAEREWWAFEKPVRPVVPRASDRRWSHNPIDAFVFRKLEEKGLEAAPRADKRTLIRRAYLDLIGLLPSPAEVDAFVEDESPDAFEKVVAGLLASAHYGERWGRHWLDVARYADSGGYEHDYDYPHAWRYRDYVIQAFNEDKPYDRFIAEQLAGDELDEVTPESLIATGFHRVGPRVGFREKDNPQYRYDYLDDMIGTTSRAFMALTVNCARCHDHKFDPISQQEYYRMMAVFFPFVNYDYPLAPPEQVAAYEARVAEIEARLEPLRKQIAEIEGPYKKMAFERLLASFPEEIQVAVKTPEGQRTAGQQLLAEQVLSIAPAGIEDLVSEADAAQIAALQQQIAAIEKELPAELPRAMGVRDGDYRFAPDGPGDEVQPGKGDREIYDAEGTFLPEAGKPYQPPPAYLLPSADYRDKGQKVEPGFPAVLTEGNPPTAQRPATGYVTSGRRRALAQWLTSPGHPLTARVMVNRIWQHHFGRGLVATANNFGKMGQKPTHPELLDWLATEFVRQGWSIKSMHRLMMNSETYQMASGFDRPAHAKIDPKNHYLWRFRQRRLEAEVIRDIVLEASGKLNGEMGGPAFFPPVPESVWQSFGKGKWELTKEGPAVWRRSVYSYWKRGLRHPMFDVFDLPDLNVSCERRSTTTVPTQALTLLNNEFVLEQARYFAERVLAQAGPEPSAQIETAYRIALSRKPGPLEAERNGVFLDSQVRYHRERGIPDAELAALTDLCDVILNLNEFVYVN